MTSTSLGHCWRNEDWCKWGPWGMAVARVFRARDALEVGLAQYRKDPLLFVMTADRCTPLRDGVLTSELHNEKSVLDPALIYGHQ